MNADNRVQPSKFPNTPWGMLPPRMDVLFVTGRQRTGAWLAEAFAADSASEVVLEVAVGLASGLARLREEIYDAVLISHEGEHLDALSLIEAMRGSGSEEQPVIVLGEQSEQQLSALCYEAGAEAYVCVNTTTTRALIWSVARAIERYRLLAENRRLRQAQQHQRDREQDEAARLLDQQRSIVAAAAQSTASPREPLEPISGPQLPETLSSDYRELLRTYVIMGSGNLGDEMERLTALLAAAEVTARQVMWLHLHVLEEMVRGLGNRSARHVLNRADILILEVVINLADRYRQNAASQEGPRRQLMLPGFRPPGARPASPESRRAA